MAWVRYVMTPQTIPILLNKMAPQRFWLDFTVHGSDTHQCLKNNLFMNEQWKGNYIVAQKH